LYLKAIELSGFKSFATKTRLDLSDGFTAIVGPNGSGKSNLADAVRWVLGEQSSRTLRGQQMGDLIFAGSSEQRASSLAEVQLIFDNSDYKLPLSQTEVTVSRRIFRDGTSEYLLGGSICRLRDIVDLFTDTGLGKASFAIIGQGQIEAILDERAEERRGIFEEASGIARQRQRKNEALARLHRVGEQLLRVGDLMDSLAENEEMLSQQAGEATLYLEAQNQLHLLENTVYYHDLLSLEVRLRNAAADLTRSSDALLTAQNEIVLTETRLLQTREELRRLDDEERQTSAGLWQSKQDQERYLGEQRLWQEKMEHLNLRRHQQHEAIAQMEQEIATLEQDCAEQQTQHGDLLERKVELEQELEQIEEERHLCEEKIQALLITKAAQREAYLDSSRQTLRDEAQLEQKKQALENLALTIATDEEQLVDLDNRRRANQQALAEAAAKEDDLQDQLEELTNEALNHQEEREAAEAQLRRASKEREELQQQRAALEARRRMLRDLEEQREGYNRTTQQLLAARDNGVPKLAGLIDLLSRVISVEPEMEIAIEVALGAASQFMVCQTEASAEDAIGWLKEHNAGRATFLPLDVSLRTSQRPAAPAKREGFIGYAADLVSCDEKYRTIVERQLGRILVMQDLSLALTYARRSGYRERIVTIQGEQLHPGGSLQGGSMPRRDSSLLARPRLLAAAEREVTELAESIARLQQNIKEAEELLSKSTMNDDQRHALEMSLERDLATALEQRRHIQLEEERLRRQQREAQAALQRTALELRALQTECVLLQERLESPDPLRDHWLQEEASLQRDEGDLRLRHQQLIAEQSTLINRLDHNEDLTSEAAARLQQSRIKQAEAGERMQLLLHGIAEQAVDEGRLSETRSSIEEQISAENTRQEELAELLQVQGRRRAVLTGSVEDTDQQLGALRRQEDRYNRRSNENRTQQVRLEDEYDYLIRRLREEHRRTPEQLLEEMDTIVANYLSSGILAQLDLSNANDLLAGLKPPSREAALKQLGPLRPNLVESMREQRDRLAALGNVNLGAIEEVQRLRERLQLLSTQGDDLRQACDDLQILIGDLEKIMSRQFVQTIQEISGVFEELFRQLFDGGEARLILSQPENPLEGGVEIIVRLPGKRTSSMTLLSGGERALTALALLLAIMRTKAPPFCLLDEVETSLDEGNLERLAGLLRTLSQGYQMMVITHRRATMEAAQTLIGITMRSRGVSTALAVKLEEIEE